MPWLLAGAVLLALCLPATALAAVSLDSPPPGSVVATSQPTFSGTATPGLFPPFSTVTVQVYAGANVAGAPVDKLTAEPDSSGKYSVPADHPLPDGTYTAQAAQGLPGTSVSSPDTFTVNATAPQVVLASPGSRPLTNATPTLTGSARTLHGDSQTVALAVYAGSAPGGTPVRSLSGTVNSNGSFSIHVGPALPDGVYAAVATQNGATATGSSSPVRFAIKVHPPALTLTSPAAGSSLTARQPTFGGAAGTSPGDAASVSVTLHAGRSATGRTLGQRTITVRGGRWTLRWPSRLAVGAYTLVVAQSDDAGHTTTARTGFRVIPEPPVIGSRVSLSGSHVAIPIGCTARDGLTCRGTVLVVSTQRLQTRPGGPVGPVRLLFAYVTIPAAHIQSVRASLPAYVIHALRGVRHLQARVTVSFTSLARSSAIRPVS
jgi:methionine-rich copper-binding protein CopC